jgi:uncharacterized damage-inducible protein DinB
MASRDELIALAAHMEWADALVWSTALQSRAAREDDRLRGWLHHLHTVQRVFTATWRGAPLQLTDIGSFDGLPALAVWGRAGLAELRAWAGAADAAAWERPVEMPWAQRFVGPGGTVTHPSVAQSLLHLSLHSAHHRGQVNARLRELGAEPPLVDYIAWIWKGRPDPMWPRNVSAPETVAG